MMKTKIILLSSCFLLSAAPNTYAMEAGHENDRTGSPTVAPKPMKEEAEPAETTKIVVYGKTGLTFDPKTRTFDGQFLDRLDETLARDLAAYYAGQLHAVADTKLPTEQKTLEDLRSKFNSGEYDALHTKKKEKIITKSELQRYEELKKQEDAILVQEAIVKKYEAQKEKYGNSLEFFPGARPLINNLLYLMTVQPHIVSFGKSFYYGKSWKNEGNEKSSLYLSGYLFSTLPEDKIEGINLDDLQSAVQFLTRFLSRYQFPDQYDDEEWTEKGSDALDYRDFFKSKSFSRLMKALPGSISQKTLDEFLQHEKAKDLRKHKKKMENEIRPLAQLNDLILKNLEAFQQELLDEKKTKKEKSAPLYNDEPEPLYPIG